MTTARRVPSGIATETLLLSIVICAYTTRRWDDVRRAVESAVEQDYAENSALAEVILVIDYCDELFDLAQAQFGSDPRIVLLRNVEKAGLSGARNTGVAAAGGDVVAFLDDDASAEPGWASALVNHYRDPHVAGVGGYASPVWPADRPSWMPPEFDWVVGCSYVGQPTQLAPVRNPIGCNMSIRRSLFAEVGTFSSEVGRVGTTPVGGEETEMCIRIRSAAATNEILFDPDIRVRHRVSDDRVTLRYFVRRCYHEGLSKAVVAELAGPSLALSTERAYIRNILPQAVIRGLASPSRGGAARAGMVVLGLVVTTAGFVRAKVARTLRARRD